MRIGDAIEKVSVLVTIGVIESGQRLVFGIQAVERFCYLLLAFVALKMEPH